MMFKSVVFTSLFAAAVAAPIAFTASCGPASRRDDFGNGSGHPDATANFSPENCTDMIDNDGDGLTDCSDPDCSGIDGCPICGQVETLQGSGFALPDGVGEGFACSTDTQCTAASAPGAPNCVFKECHASYDGVLNFVGFGQGAVLDDTSKLLKVCAKLEHSWLRDMQIELIAPSGQSVPLKKFMDRTGGEIYLGHANDSDTAANPVPGVGYDYCWTAQATATTTMLNATMENWNEHDVVPAGDYMPDVPFTALQGATLNGMWDFRVTDLWPEDNGFLFDWTIEFDPSLVSDCSGPIIE
jgi:hypothetical protein